MVNRIAVSALLIAAALSPSAHAGVYADGLSKCLVQSTTTADKHALVKWMFATAALHPDVRSIASVTAAERDGINRGVAALFERLLTVACRKETQQALQYEGTTTLETSFQVLGQVAGRELLGDPAVGAGLAATMKYIDPQKMKELAPKTK